MRFIFRGFILVLAALCYVGALALPAFYLTDQGYPGWVCLAFGWLGVFDGRFPWIANLFWPPLLLAVLVGRSRVGVVLGVLAAGFALSAFLLSAIEVDEGGGKRDIIGYGAGLYLWLASIGIPSLWCFLDAVTGWVLNAAKERRRLNMSL